TSGHLKPLRSVNSTSKTAGKICTSSTVSQSHPWRRTAVIAACPAASGEATRPWPACQTIIGSPIRSAIIPPPPIMPLPIMFQGLVAPHAESPTASPIQTAIKPREMTSKARCPIPLPEPEGPSRLLVVSLTEFPGGEAPAEDVFWRVGAWALAARELADHPDDKDCHADQEDTED